jgi:hypothetical protein
MLKTKFPTSPRTHDSVRSRCTDYLQPDAHIKGKMLDRRLSNQLRSEAFAFLDKMTTEPYSREDLAYVPTVTHRWSSMTFDDEDAGNDGIPGHPDLKRSSGKKWTAVEDAELIRLREFVVKEADWKKIAARFKKMLPDCHKINVARCASEH